MANVQFSEAEYQALFGVVIDLQEKGDIETAQILDRLAQKMNTALSRSRFGVVPGFANPSAEARANFQAESPLETWAKAKVKMDERRSSSGDNHCLAAGAKSV